MKKVLVLAAAVALFATPAMAAITGTAHDLSAMGGAGTELCVFCHTPHGAGAVAGAPLWNRSTVQAAGAIYTGVDIQNTATLATVNATDAPLCLSCHDGTVAEVLNNEPNAGATDASGYAWGNAEANLGTDMTNDHPIGFDYAATQLLDTELDTKGNAETDLGTGALSFGSGNDMWCSSCHDVHGVTGVPTFLRIANTTSNLCKACHVK